MGKDEPPWRGRPCRRVVKALALPLPLPRARRSNRRTAPFPPTSAISPPSPRGLIFTHIFSVISSFSKAIRALSLSVFNPCSIRGSGTLVAALPLWVIRGQPLLAKIEVISHHAVVLPWRLCTWATWRSSILGLWPQRRCHHALLPVGRFDGRVAPWPGPGHGPGSQR